MRRKVIRFYSIWLSSFIHTQGETVLELWNVIIPGITSRMKPVTTELTLFR